MHAGVIDRCGLMNMPSAQDCALDIDFNKLESFLWVIARKTVQAVIRADSPGRRTQREGHGIAVLLISIQIPLPTCVLFSQCSARASWSVAHRNMCLFFTFGFQTRLWSHQHWKRILLIRFLSQEANRRSSPVMPQLLWDNAHIRLEAQSNVFASTWTATSTYIAVAPMMIIYSSVAALPCVVHWGATLMI